jgi:NADH-ubiquinone oxidoreductase chain 5
LGAGSVIHAVADEQDMRRMGGLKRLVPFTFALMSIGSFALMGFPFLTGFYSKDVILEVAFGKYTATGHFAYWLGAGAAFFTAFYSMRLAFLTFLSEPNGYKPVLIGAHDAPIKMALPLLILSVPSIFIGYLSRDLFIGLGSPFWNGALFVMPSNLNAIDAEFIPHFFKLLPVGLSLTGATFALVLYTFSSKGLYVLKTSVTGRKIYNFLNRKWFFDKVYNECISQTALSFGYFISYKTIDRGIIEMLGPWGLSKTVLSQTSTLSRLQTGLVFDYSLWMFFGVLLMILLVVGWEFLIFLLDPSLIFIFIVTVMFAIN